MSMATATPYIPLEHFIDEQRRADEEQARIELEKFNARRNEYLTEQFGERTKEVAEHISPELLQALNASLVNVDREDEQFPSRFEVQFTIDGEPWSIGLSSSLISPPDHNQLDEYGDSLYERIPSRVEKWDDAIIRAIRKYRQRVKDRAAKDTRPSESPKKPYEPVPGPYRVESSIYANKLADKLNKLEAEGYFVYQIHLEQGGPDYAGTYTVIAQKRGGAA